MDDTGQDLWSSDGDDPLALFDRWLIEAGRFEPEDPNAMCLATATPSGVPSARMVLLKGHDRSGFVFYTNTGSRKGAELATNPAVALLFHWKSLRRQVRIEGRAEPVTTDDADRYFASRHRLSRLGAHASDQSRPLESRHVLTNRLAELERRYPDQDIPRPDDWSGFRVVPDRLEFWRDMPHRLHHRTVYARSGAGETSWRTWHLYP